MEVYKLKEDDYEKIVNLSALILIDFNLLLNMMMTMKKWWTMFDDFIVSLSMLVACNLSFKQFRIIEQIEISFLKYFKNTSSETDTSDYSLIPRIGSYKCQSIGKELG